MTLLTVLRVHTKPICVIKAVGIHTLYVHYSSNTDNIAKQMRHSTKLQKFKSLLTWSHSSIGNTITKNKLIQSYAKHHIEWVLNRIFNILKRGS